MQSDSPTRLNDHEDVSVIVPTYKDADNLPVLVPRMAEALAAPNLTAEIIVVDDDSPDRTGAVCKAPEPDWLNGGQVPALDGLRAISILLVVLAHIAVTGAFRGSESPVRWWLESLGALGVDMFFVISGFLITLLLLRERQKTGRISLRGFYVRRALRILPAYFTFLFGVFVFTRLDLALLQSSDWIAAFTYTVNFIRPPGSAWEIGHLWSLSLEEHFYLLWPVLFCVLSPKRALLAVGLCVAVVPFVRLAVWSWWAEVLNVYQSTPTRMDSIAIGCGLALLAHLPAFRRCRLSARKTVLVVVLVVTILAVSFYFLMKWQTGFVVFFKTLDALAFAIILWVCVNQRRGFFGYLLNSRVLVTVGLMSYSIYLWQQLFLNPRSEWLFQWPVNIILVVVCAAASFFLVERPFLRLKGYVQSRK